MKLNKWVDGALVFSEELPAHFDERTKMLEFNDHILCVPFFGEPACIDRLTCQQVLLSDQKQIEARLVAAKVMGGNRGLH